MSFCLGGKVPPNPNPSAWECRDGREQLMEPHPRGAGEQQEGDPAGKLSPAQAEPALAPQMW